MDDKPSMRRLGFNTDENEEGDLQLKVIEEFRFTEDLKQNLDNTPLMTDNVIFTGTEMYQGLKKQTEFKDQSHYEFEMQRVKRLEVFRRNAESSVVSGPY